MNNIKRVRNLIKKEFKSLAITTIAESGEGMDNEAYLINDTYIFRFPKRKSVCKNLRKEICVLPKLQPVLNLAIPHFEYVSKKMAFAGYKKIPGIFLTRKLYSSLENKTDIQKSLAVFLTIVHNTNLSTLEGCKLRIINFKKEYQEDFKNIKATIYPHLSIQDQQLITKQFNSYFENKSNFNYTPVLLHNDFSADHILINESNHKINGIIDFGDIAIGDPDYDLIYLLIDIGQTFVKDFLRFYNHSNHTFLFKKLNFFLLANILQRLITSHHEMNRREIKQGMTFLNKWLTKNNKSPAAYHLQTFSRANAKEFNVKYYG